MSSYSFNFNLAGQTVDHMSRVNQQINTALGELETYAGQHMAEWTGAAKEQYEVSKQRWNAAADQMAVCLANASQSLFNISDAYGTAEQRQAQIWGDRHM